MHWSHKRLNYEILIPKLNKSIFQLNEKEAEAYFQWFIEIIPERVAYVAKTCAKDLWVSEDRVDCSPESLVLLWKWFRRRAKTERVPHTGGNQQQSCQDKIIRNERQLTLETEYIIRDIGMYLGETFRKNNPSVYWTYYTTPRRDFFVNHPLLKGFVDRSTGQPFEMSFEPIHMAGVQASKLINKESKDTDLLQLYNWWAERID